MATCGSGRSMRLSIMDEDPLSTPLSDVDALLYCLTGSDTLDLLFLRTIMYAARLAMTAPMIKQPIARPAVLLGDNLCWSFDAFRVASDAVIRLEDVLVELPVRADGCSVVRVSADSFVLEGRSLEVEVVVVAPPTLATPIEPAVGEADALLDPGARIMCNALPSAPFTLMSVGDGGAGLLEGGMVASSCKTTGEIWLDARTHGGTNTHVGVYVTIVLLVVEIGCVILSA